MSDRTAGPGRPDQTIKFYPLEGTTLEQILRLPDPLFIGSGNPWRQLHYVDNYVRHPMLGCKSVLLEEHYIDRDHMEDHSVFYSKNLRQYPNSCRRLHFFSLNEHDLKEHIGRLQALAVQSRSTKAEFAAACAEFSQSHYLGFSVIKPLPGCPVGRTVIRCLPPQSGKGHQRSFPCAFDYTVHVFGLPLSVFGLAFQQQDIGVSACATTALWTSLQNARQLEQSGFATPAQITMRASQFTLPFGRPMPSPGLSLDQMCQAIQSLGYSPSLYRTEATEDAFSVSLALLHSAISSGISPVLVMSLQGKNTRHAVAVAGMAIAPGEGLTKSEVRHISADVIALYIHDDRNGPYMKATIGKQNTRLQLRLQMQKEKVQVWTLTHILIPMHGKIRLSFRGLYQAGLEIFPVIQAFLESRLRLDPSSTLWSSRIIRAHSYLEGFLREGRIALANRLYKSVALPRYVGVLHVEAPSLKTFDILIDTTSTERNVNYVGIVQLDNDDTSTNRLCERIAQDLACPTFA